MKRLLKESADAAYETSKLVKTINGSSGNITATLENLNSASLEIKNHSQEIGKKTSELLTGIDAGVNDLRQHMQRISKNIETIAMNLEKTLKSFEQLSSTTNEIMMTNKDDIILTLKDLRQMSSDMKIIARDIREGKGVLGKLMRSDALAKDLDKVAVNIHNLSERLADHPEILLFGDSEEDRRKAQAARDKREQRRAFNEGYGSRLGTRRPGLDKDAKKTEAPSPQPESADNKTVEVIE